MRAQDSSAGLLEVTSSLNTRRAVETQDFMAVIMVGYGEHLYPLNEGTHVISKALLPIGNVPIINLVLNWVLQSGLTDILLIVPPAYHAPISNHLNENFTASTHPRARIELKRHTDGEKDDEEDKGEGGSGDYAGGMDPGGTARLLRRFKNHIKSDFVLLPCDIAPPSSLPLDSILDKHRGTPEAILTAVFYEAAESVKEGEEKILVGMDKETEDLLLIQPLEAMEDELEMRMSLFKSHPTVSLTTRLLDAHIYVMRRTVLDLLSTRRSKDLDSMREQVIPWLIKGTWQKGLSKRWAPILDPPLRDPLAAALARSTTTYTARPGPSLSPSASHVSSPASNSTPLSRSADGSPSPSRQADDNEPYAAVQNSGPWRCQAIVHAPPPAEVPMKGGKPDKSKVVTEPEHLIRANSLAGYWELNRRLIRNLPTGPGSSPHIGSTEEGAISASAQISPDTIVGEGTRVGERASIKKCVVGRHCVIGRGAKLTGCVLWDFVVVEENARIENSILCSNVRIGEKSAIKDCEFGTGFEAKAGVNLKGERLIAGQEA